MGGGQLFRGRGGTGPVRGGDNGEDGGVGCVAADRGGPAGHRHVGTEVEHVEPKASGRDGKGQPTLTTGDTLHERAQPAGHDTSGPNTDDAMTRSEERVDVGTQEQEAGRVRLRKYVETEHVTQAVPVRKEKALLEREPITDSNVDQALDGPAISEEEHEVVLHEERPVVDKTTEPVERVRLGKDTEVADETVSEEIRKEQIEVEGDVDDRRA